MHTSLDLHVCVCVRERERQRESESEISFKSKHGFLFQALQPRPPGLQSMHTDGIGSGIQPNWMAFSQFLYKAKA